jgi:hypothetical protein
MPEEGPRPTLLSVTKQGRHRTDSAATAGLAVERERFNMLRGFLPQDARRASDPSCRTPAIFDHHSLSTADARTPHLNRDADGDAVSDEPLDQPARGCTTGEREEP